MLKDKIAIQVMHIFRALKEQEKTISPLGDVIKMNAKEVLSSWRLVVSRFAKEVWETAALNLVDKLSINYILNACLQIPPIRSFPVIRTSDQCTNELTII